MRALIVAVVTTVAASATAACGGPQRTAITAAYPSYTPEEAALFDDSAAPAIFNVVVAGPTPGRDPKLVERTQRADSVFRAKISTVTESGGGGFELVVEPLGEPLAGARQTDAIGIGVPPTAPAHPFVRSSSSNLAGRTVVFFVRRYNREGDVEIHWRAEPDTHEVRVAIQDARALAEFNAPPQN